MSYVTCKELITFLDDYIAGDIPLPHRALFERHLSVCRSCKEYLSSYRETIRLARAATPSTPAVEDIPPELLTLILSTVARNTTP